MKNLYKIFYSINEFENQDNNLVNLENDYENQFEEFQEVFKELDKLLITPKQTIIDNVLSFVKKSCNPSHDLV